MFQKLKEIFAREELKELDKLRVEIETYKSKQLSLDDIIKEVDSYKENILKNQAIFDSKENSYKSEIINLKKELDFLKDEKLNESNDNKKTIDNLKDEIKKLNSNKENNDKESQEFQNSKLKIQELSTTIEINNKSIEDKNNIINALEKNIESLKINLNDFKINESNYLQKIQNLTDNIKKLELELNSINKTTTIQNLTTKRKEIKNILIVDDSKIITVQAEKGLTQKGFNVQTSISGKAAIEILNTNQIDLVITDVNMPEMNGVELTLWIKDNKPECPVLLMTAFETEEIKKYTLEFNSNMFLEKPLNFDNVVSKINNINNNLYPTKLNLKDIMLMFIIARMNQVVNILKDDNNLLGKIYFSLGEIIHAEYSNLTGINALEQIMNYKLYRLSNNDITEIPSKTINESSIQLLLKNNK
ncbi:MAG: response regulator [Candidatus Sericytochromatia bacterium]